MAYFNDIWRVWFKGATGSYVEVNDIQIRNVVGSGLTSAFLNNSDGIYITDAVVIRCEVLEILSSTTISISKTLPLLSDVGYTGYGFESPKTVHKGSEWRSELISNVDATIASDIQVGDIFEIGSGYYWDETNGVWIPNRAFGVVAQGQFSDVLTMKAQNISGKGQIYVAVGWYNDGVGLVSARQVDGIWSGPGETPLLVAGAATEQYGYVAIDDYFEIEFRMQVPDAASTEYNPMTFNVWIQGEGL